MPSPFRRAFESLFNLGEKPTYASPEPPKIQELQILSSKTSLNCTRDLMADSNLASSALGDLVTTPKTPQHNGTPSNRAPQTNGNYFTPSKSAQADANGIIATRTPQPDDTPTKQPTNGLHPSSQPPYEANSYSSPHDLSSQPGTPTSEDAGVQWSAAVGRASLGKSGRVIDRLMGDNDRLRREKTLATAKLEEELKKGESARSTLDALEASNANLQSLHDIDKTALTRKDRKIEEMKAELDAERSRREKAEAEVRITRTEREEAVEQYRKEAMKEQEECRFVTTQYDVLSKSWKSMEQSYQRQTQKLRADIKSLQDCIAKDQKKLSHLELISDQLRQEADKSHKANEQFVSQFEAYKQEQSKSWCDLKDRAQRNNITNDEILKEVELVMGQMRYVVNVKKDVKDAE